MGKFIAHYHSLDTQSSRARGLFEFESEGRLASKANAHDARVRMLELFGNDALAWQIEKIERAGNANSKGQADGQLELDFREPAQEPPKRRTSTKRGIV